MKYQIKVTELSHDDLVTLFSDATYGNSEMIAISVSKTPENFTPKGDCREDRWAEILLQGGTLLLHDMAGATDSVPTKVDYQTAKSWKARLNTEWHNNFFGGNFYTPDYEFSLADIIKGLSKKEAADYLQDFVNERGDMWTSYNLLQIAIFGEVVYG